MLNNNLTPQQEELLNYDGELTLEALAALDTYTKQCCNTSATARKLHKNWLATKKLLTQPYVRELFKLKLMQKGVTPERIAETINLGLQASNGIYHDGVKVTDEPNWSARQKFAQLAAEIFEVLKYANKIEVNNNNKFLMQSFSTIIESAYKTAGEHDRTIAGNNTE